MKFVTRPPARANPSHVEADECSLSGSMKSSFSPQRFRIPFDTAAARRYRRLYDAAVVGYGRFEHLVRWDLARSLGDAAMMREFWTAYDTSATRVEYFVAYALEAGGDLATVERHLASLDPADRDAYRVLAREAARLSDRRDTAVDRLLDDLRLPEADR